MPSTTSGAVKLEALARYIENLSNGAMNVAGWTTVTAVRTQGSTAGQTDVYFIPPANFPLKKRRFRSRAEVARALGLLEGKPKPMSGSRRSTSGIHIWAIGRPCTSRERAQSRQKLLKLVTPRKNRVPDGWYESGHRWIGQRVARHFEGQGVPDMLGEITAWLPPSENDSKALFHCIHGDNDAEDLDSTEVNSGLRLHSQWKKSGINTPKVQWDLKEPMALSLDGTFSVLKSLTDFERNTNTTAPAWSTSKHLLKRARSGGKENVTKGSYSLTRFVCHTQTNKQSGTENKSSKITCVVHKLGRIDLRKGYSDSRTVFPIGYSCSVPFVSLRAENAYAMLNMSIKEGTKGPIFVASQTFDSGAIRYISFEANTLSELWMEIQKRVRKAKESRIQKYHASVFSASSSMMMSLSQQSEYQSGFVAKLVTKTSPPTTPRIYAEEKEEILCPVRGCERLYKGKRSLMYHIDNSHFSCRKVVRDALKGCKTAAKINAVMKDKEVVMEKDTSSSMTVATTTVEETTTATTTVPSQSQPEEPPKKKMKKPATPPGRCVRVRVRFEGRILNKTNAVIDESKKKQQSMRIEFEARAMFGLIHPEVVSLLPGMSGSENLATLLPPMSVESVLKGYISAMSGVAWIVQGHIQGEAREIARIERQLMREEEKEVRRLMREQERLQYREMLDAIQAPSTNLVSRCQDEWNVTSSSLMTSSTTNTTHVAPPSSSTTPIPYLFDTTEDIPMLEKIIKSETDEDILVEVYEFLKIFSFDLDPELTFSAISSEASQFVKSTLQKLSITTLLKALTEPKDVFGANSVLPYRTIVTWLLQPIFADMDEAFFGQVSGTMSCSRALASMSWSEASQRYLKVLEFGGEMNAHLLGQVMGCDVKTGRKRGRVRCWTQAELLARKSSSASSTPQSAMKRPKKFHAYKYVSLDEKNPDPNVSEEEINRWGFEERLMYIGANIRACVRTNTNISGGTKTFKLFHSTAVRAARHPKIPTTILNGIIHSISNFKSNACGDSKRKLLIVLNEISALSSSDSTGGTTFTTTPAKREILAVEEEKKQAGEEKKQDEAEKKQEEEEKKQVEGQKKEAKKTRSTLNLTWDQPVEHPEDFGVCGTCHESGNNKSTTVSCSKPGCPGIYHVKCVKIKTKHFLCSWCSKKRNQRKFAKLSTEKPTIIQLRKILDEIEMHDYSYAFLNAVDLELYPSYAEMIKEPMDLGTIRQRVENFEYISEDGSNNIEGAKRFVHDLLLVFNNCQTFNRPGSGLYLLAAQMLEFCRVDLLGTYGEGKIRKQAVYTNNNGTGASISSSSAVATSSSKDISVANWHDFNIPLVMNESGEEENEEEVTKVAFEDTRLKLIKTISNSLQNEDDLSPNLRLIMLKYLCDMSCVTRAARKSLRRRRDRRDEISYTARDSCKSALDEEKQKNGGSLGSISEDAVLMLKQLSHAYQRHLDDRKLSPKLHFIGSDSSGSRYYWHGASGVKVYENSNPIRVKVSEHGSILIRNNSENNGKRWSCVSDFSKLEQNHPIASVSKSLSEKNDESDKRVGFMLNRIQEHAKYCHRR